MPSEARRFIAGKLFAFNCFEGTRGAGRIYADGSVAGTVQISGSGPSATPAAGRHAAGQAAKRSAPLKGMPFQPCFNLPKTTPTVSAARSPASASPIAISIARAGRNRQPTSVPRQLSWSSQPALAAKLSRGMTPVARLARTATEARDRVSSPGRSCRTTWRSRKAAASWRR